MAGKRNPFEILNNMPFLDEKFFREIAGMDWSDSRDVLNHLGRNKWPPLNLVETTSEIIITAEIPGLEKHSDVLVELKGNTLIINGEIATEAHDLQEVKVHEEERRTGKFSRTVTLPAAINSKSAQATYRQGILEIRLTKILDNQVKSLNIDFVK